MKVLNINGYYLSSSLYKNMNKALEERYISLTNFIPIQHGYRVRTECLQDSQIEGIEHCFNKFDKFFYNKKQEKIYKRFSEKYSLEKYSLIHAHSLFLNGNIALKSNKKYIVTVQNTDVNIFFKKFIWLRKVGIEILAKSEKIIFISEAYKDRVINEYIPNNMKKIIRDKSIIIPFGVDEFWYDHMWSHKKINSNNIKIIYVGMVNKNKNILATAKAIDNMIKNGINIEFKIIGKNNDNKILKKLKKYKFINYLGELSKEELLIEYRNSDIFSMPSKTETFGLAYVEALTQGLPIIYTKEEGFDKQFDNFKIGVAVDSTKINEIEDAIKYITKNYKDMSKNAIENIEKFKWENISKKYLDLYNNCLKRI